MDRCVKAVRLEVDSCAERDSLEDGGEIIRYRLEDGYPTFGTSIFDGAAFTRTYPHVHRSGLVSSFRLWIYDEMIDVRWCCLTLGNTLSWPVSVWTPFHSGLTCLQRNDLQYAG